MSCEVYSAHDIHNPKPGDSRGLPTCPGEGVPRCPSWAMLGTPGWGLSWVPLLAHSLQVGVKGPLSGIQLVLARALR